MYIYMKQCVVIISHWFLLLYPVYATGMERSLTPAFNPDNNSIGIEDTL